MKLPAHSFFKSACFLLVILITGWMTWRRSDFSASQKPSGIAAVQKNSSVLAQLKTKQPKGITCKSSPNKASNSLRRILKEPAPLHEVSVEEWREFSGAKVVEAAEIDGPEPGQKTRLRILKTHFKYPFIRTEEIIDTNNNSLLSRLEMIADHLLLMLPLGEDPDVFLKKFGPQATSIVSVTPDAPVYCVNFATASLETLPQALEQAAVITSGISEPDFIKHLTIEPNNPLLNYQWQFLEHHQSFNDAGTAKQLYPGIGAQEAWNIRTDASSVIVAVIDTGICYTHEALASNMWHNPSVTQGYFHSNYGDIYGWNAYDHNGDPMDHDGHGTFCAGIIGAMGNDGVGICGVAWKVQLMACKIFNGEISTVFDEISSIDYALDHGAQILNCSFGGYSPIAEPLEHSAFERARDKGVIVVCAAGNDSYDNDDFFSFYPASDSLDNIVSVAAMSEGNQLASWSNYGAKSVHLAAPGANIYSTCVLNDKTTAYHGSVIGSGNSCYALGNGTSFAAPFVTGTLALLKAQFPEESYQSLIARLLAAVDPLPELHEKVKTGGKLNIYNALTGSKPILPIPPSGKNAESFSSWYESNW